MKPIVTLIAAVARNGVIGSGNTLIWRIPTDLKHFKARTLGKPLIMGRKTFDSIGSPLPGRRSIVVTRDPAWSHAGVERAGDLAEALSLAAGERPEEIMIGGGGEVYAQTISTAGRLYITEVDLAPKGDARFPSIDPSLWLEVRRVGGARGPRDEAEFTFVDYERNA